ncbi:hypothetical protein BGY98DRAFT_234507 [Russula aff. rugulosa BPL654]|nr:hypothetical protein BGY98DRAFT_234507 [Russula aff. rugulosa BPL654]
MTRIWKEVLTTVEGLLIPPLSEAPSDMKPLTDKEVDIVFKWLKFLRDFFYADGGGLPLENLQNQKYRDIVSIRLYYDWDTDMLMEECVRAMQQTLRAAPSIKKRAKSVYSQRNLGTIKDRKREKKRRKKSVVEKPSCAFSGCDRIRPSSSRNNCRSWRQCRPSRNSASASSRCGGPRGRWRSPHPRSTGCARNTSLTSGVEYRTTPSLFRRRVIPTLLFPFAIVVDTLRMKSIPSIHTPIIHSLLCSLLATSPLGSSFIIIVSFFSVS